MITEQHVARLESLLATIRRNAARLRVAPPPEPATQIAELEEDDLEIEDADIFDSDAPPSALAPSATSDARNIASATEVEGEGEGEGEAKPPRSSARAQVVASSMAQALAELDVPLQTQLPESGAGGAPAVTAAKGTAGIQLDDAEELELKPNQSVPAVAEDYAPTVQLEEPFDAELELDDAPPPVVPDRSLVPGHQLAEPADHEVSSLPPPASSVAPRGPTAISDSDAPPASSVAPRGPTAISDSDAPPASSVAPREPATVFDSSIATTPAPAFAPAPSTGASALEVQRREPEPETLMPPVAAVAIPELKPAAPQLLSRSKVDPTVQPIRYIKATREFRPQSFLELLDASLSLGSSDGNSSSG